MTLSRVAYLLHSAAPSGAELALSRALLHWDIDMPVLLVVAEDGPMLVRFKQAGATVDVMQFRSRRRHSARSGVSSKVALCASLCAYAVRLRRRIRRAQPDVVVAGSLRAVFYGRLSLALSRKPFVWSVHDRLSRDYVGSTLATVLFSRIVPKFCTALIVNSESTLSTLAHDGKPVLICPPGANIQFSEIHIREDVQSFICLGRLAPWKGQDVAIRAFGGALQSGELRPNAVLHIVGGALFGEAAYADGLRSLACELGIEDSVVFHGHVDDPQRLLRECDVLIHSSVIPEPFGSVVIEGMVHDCLVIASTPGGPAEVVIDGRSGLLSPCGDVEALQRRMADVAALPRESRLEILRRARSALPDYDISLTTRARCEFLRSVIQGELKPRVYSWREFAR